MNRPTTIEGATHPALILLLIGCAAVLFNGGIDYLPYTTDEFTNWIGVSRVIHWAGSYDTVREGLYLPGYTPGWRLLLVLPWQIGGGIEFGMSAAATLVFHVALLALAYDLAVWSLHHDAGLSKSEAQLTGWLALLAILAAEATGRLWTYEMLIEQPQVYIMSMAALLVLRAELIPSTRFVSYFAAGLTLAAGFLIKNAIAAAIPGAGLVALSTLLEQRLPLSNRIRESMAVGLLLLGPIAAVMLTWHVLGPRGDCLASPVATLTTAAQKIYDPLNLALRLSTAIADYVGTYKLVVTIAAAAGFGLAAYLRLFRSMLLWCGFLLSYFFALYWYHLTCFDPFHYTQLNSIPRFTRVPLQVFHLLGLLLLGISLLRIIPNGWVSLGQNATGRKSKTIACILLLSVLGAWQTRQTYRSVVDLTTRAYQNVDPRIAEMRNAAEYVRRHAGATLAPWPRLAILAQGQDADVRTYAAYYASQLTSAGVIPVFDLYPDSSWSPSPINVWQTRTVSGNLTRELGALDILWPIHVDSWLLDELHPLIEDKACIDRLPDVVLVRNRVVGEAHFRCFSKNS